MTEELKLQIIAAAADYAKKNNLTNSDIATKSKINNSYISNMMRNIFTVQADGKTVEIAEKYFFKLAEFCDINLKKQYWHTVQTNQFVGVIAALENAKATGRISVIICETGNGKTFTVDKFVHTHPQHTYKITVSDMHNLKDILGELMDHLRIEQGWSNASKMIRITNKLKELKRSGARPIIIIDEAENLKLPVIKSLKAMYDFVNGYTSIALIGTPQLTSRLEKMRKKDRPGVPQFCRRIKSSIREISSVGDFKPFFEAFKIVDRGLQKLLNSLCDNYGELHDYLEPFLREADENDWPLSEEKFRLMYNLPNYQ